MTPNTLVIRSSRVVTPSGMIPASVHIDGETIRRVAPFDDVGNPARLVTTGDVVMPGIVDSHVHVNEPGRTEWEGFQTATRSAAAGGVTTIVDMPLNSIPPTTTLEGLKAKLAALEGCCQVDVGLWGGAIPGNRDELPALLAGGVLGFKAFMIDSGVPEFPPLDATGLREALETLRASGVPLLVHAELAGPIVEAAGSLTGSTTTYRRYLASRPAAAECQAIELIYDLCKQTGGRAHIVHLSAAGGIPILARARETGVKLSAETTPHYLYFESESIPDGSTAWKCAPPIRERANRETLWQGLESGQIEMIVSDHSPCTANLKHLDSGDFERAWGGIASLQFALPVVWTAARKRGFGLTDLARWMCQAPSSLAGLDAKGSIAEGSDADLTIFSPDEEFTVTSEGIEHRNKLTPYEGQTLCGLVLQTYVRGALVYDEGRFPPPIGRWIRRSRRSND